MRESGREADGARRADFCVKRLFSLRKALARLSRGGYRSPRTDAADFAASLGACAHSSAG